MKVCSRTYMISTDFYGRILNLFLVEGASLMLIDSGIAGMPASLILPYMAEQGLSTQDVTLMASTHAHADHMGGNVEMQAACPNARLGVHELDRPWVESHLLHQAENYERFPDLGLYGPDLRQLITDWCGADSPVQLAWHGGEQLDLGGRQIEVIHAPGHTQGNLVFLDRENGILFEGESILGGAAGEPGKLGVPYYYDVAAYRASMHYLAELPWEQLLSSHAMPRDRTAGLQAIQESLDFVDLFHGQVKALLEAQSGPAPFAALCEALGRRYGYAYDLGLVLLMETHLKYLERTKEAAHHCGDWAKSG